MPPKKRPVAVPQEYFEGSWHLDKRIPVALIVTMFAQLAAGLWWASQINNDVTKLKNDVQSLQHDIKQQSAKFENLAVVASEIQNLNKSFDRLERNLETIVKEGRKR